MISLTVILRFLQKRDDRKRAAENGVREDVETSVEAVSRASVAEAATASIKDGVTLQK
jgi:hypothetical protein